MTLKRLCGVQRDRPRTFGAIIAHLAALNTQGLLPDLGRVKSCEQNDSEDEILRKERKVA